jgi:hypothetical protein
LNVTSKLMNMDASSDQIQESLTANNKNWILLIMLFPIRYPHKLKKTYSKKEQCPSKWDKCTHQGDFQTLDDAADPPE